MSCRNLAVITFRSLVLAVLLVLAAPTYTSAQDRDHLISQETARRFGLQRMWFTQVAVDSGRGQIKHVSQYISHTKFRYVFELSYDDQTLEVSSTDLDAFGVPLEREGAKTRADKLKANLEHEGKTVEIKEVMVPQITLVFTTDRGGVDVIDGETGRRFWSDNIGHTDHPTLAAAVDDEHVAVVNGSYVFLMKRDTGEIVWKRKTTGVPGAGPALNRFYVFVPMFSGALESYSVKDPTMHIGVYRATGHALIQPAITRRSVVWPTDKGHMYVAPSDRVGIRFRIEAKKTIVATPAHAGRNLYIPSIDGYIYCVDEMTGGMLWTVSIGEALAREPVAVGNRLYVPSVEKNLFCLSLEDGTLVWTASGIDQVLTVGRDRIFCVGTESNLVTLNIETGSVLMSGMERLPEFRITNSVTNRLFIGTPTGLIQGLREVGEEFPTIHFPEQSVLPGAEPINPFGEEAEDPFNQEEETPAGAGAEPGAAEPGAAEPGAAAPGAAGPGAEKPADPFEKPKPNP